MYYRKEDIDDACEARSRLQLEAWPTACFTLASLPNFRNFRIFIANPFHLDSNYLGGNPTSLFEAIVSFLRECKDVRANVCWEVFLPMKRMGKARDIQQWNLRSMEFQELKALGDELRKLNLKCRIHVGDILCSEDEIELVQSHYTHDLR